MLAFNTEGMDDHAAPGCMARIDGAVYGVQRITPLRGVAPPAAPGTVLAAAGGMITLCCGDGVLQVQAAPLDQPAEGWPRRSRRRGGISEQSNGFNGLGMHLGNLSRLSRAQTRSISPENLTGEKGHGGMATEGGAAARDLGQGWKISPSSPSRRASAACWPTSRAPARSSRSG